ncbi:MAG: alpha/beta fold hydrolase [Flavobacteriales bacterium]|jgi:pimeloyl-ACP methyl ester carboxylesterase|nr:MAG: alpha/beta fold hydrolase [Flavobacteriales bacterium]
MTLHPQSGPAPVRYFTHGVTLAYRTYGQGPLQAVAFHGFGRTGEDYRILQGPLGDRLTIHAFDLHFHGQSPGYPHRADEPFAPEELASFFRAFLDSMQAPKAALIGYSLGGRIALCLLEQLPERFCIAFLAAPDGLKTRPWYRGLAASAPGRWAYKRFVAHPGRIHLLIDVLRAMRLMNERMHRFLKGQTDSRAKRQLVHDVWLSYRRIEPDLGAVAKGAAGLRLPIHLFFGKHDRIIKPALGPRLSGHAPEVIRQHELPFGHVLLTTELGDAMRELLGD